MSDFSTEIQSHNFGGNNYLSIECIALEHHKKDYYRKFLSKNTSDELIREFHSYLSDDSKQD